MQSSVIVSLCQQTTVLHYYCLNSLEQECIRVVFLFVLPKSGQMRTAVCMTQSCALMFCLTFKSNVFFCLNSFYYVPRIMLINDAGDNSHHYLSSGY